MNMVTEGPGRGATELHWVERYGGWVITGIALIVRVAVLRGLPYIITRDGIRYVERAERLAAGDWVGAFAGADFNLFPVLIAWMHGLLSWLAPITFEQAALVLNVTSGTAVVSLLYWVTRKLAGGRAALMVGVYGALLPELVRASCGVIREAPYLCLLVLGCGLIVEGVRAADVEQWRLWELAIAGGIFVIAALLRLEALGVLGCAGVVVLVAHAGRGWQLGRRLRALGALLVLVPVIGLVCLGAVRVRSGQWHFARLDKLHKGYSLGRREVVLEDVLYTTKTPAYRDDGTVDVATLVRVNFFKMARRNREVLCAAELVTGIGQALQVGGLLLLGAAVWSGRGRWRAWVGEPTHVLALTATLVLGAVYFRYVSNNYVFSARYALTLIVIWCLAMGSSWRVFSALRGWRRMAAWIGGGVALLWLVVEVIQPKDARFLPLRGTGEILRGMMPREARVVAAPGLLQVAYYAQRPFVMLPGQRRMDLATYVASTNGYVLINHHDAWQAGCIGELTSGLERVEVSLPSNRYYAFSVYRARAGRE